MYEWLNVPPVPYDLFLFDRFLGMSYARQRQAIFSQSILLEKRCGLKNAFIVREQRCFDGVLTEWGFEEYARVAAKWRKRKFTFDQFVGEKLRRKRLMRSCEILAFSILA